MFLERYPRNMTSEDEKQMENGRRNEIRQTESRQERYNNEDYMKNIECETPNLLHCYSSNKTFRELMKGLDIEEKRNFKINDYYVDDFILGSSEPGKVNHNIYDHRKIPIHFCVKVRSIIFYTM
jgi:hypothetical protein